MPSLSVAAPIQRRCRRPDIPAPPQSAGPGQHAVHRPVVRLDRERRRPARRRTPRPRPRAAVRGRARSYEPPPWPSRRPATVDGERRRQHEVGVRDRVAAERGPAGSQHAEPAVGELAGAGEHRPVEIQVGSQHRQQHAHAARLQRIEQRAASAAPCGRRRTPRWSSPASAGAWRARAAPAAAARPSLRDRRAAPQPGAQLGLRLRHRPVRSPSRWPRPTPRRRPSARRRPDP